MNKTKTIIFVLLSFIILNSSFLIQVISAQSAISLSVSPPLLEVIIKPGKEVSQIYTVTNNGGDTVITPNIVYFTSTSQEGNVKLTTDPAPDWVRYDKNPFSLKSGDSKQFTVLISPPNDAEEVDHFLTLTFESSTPAVVDNQNSVFYKSEIGTNILLSISKDGVIKKSAEIIEFKAPKVVDSLLGEISYLVTIKNSGNSFFKPIGKIITDSETLKLAPQNIVSSSTRTIYCLDQENLIDCKLDNKFRIGKITSKLEFIVDEDSKVYKSELTTYVFPFSIIGVGVIVFILLTVFKKDMILGVWRKRT